MTSPPRMTPGALHTVALAVKRELANRDSPEHTIDAAVMRNVCWHICATLNTSRLDTTNTTKLDDLAGLIADVMWKYPRDLWLVQIIGPHWINPSTHELDDTRDIANPEEWGGVG